MVKAQRDPKGYMKIALNARGGSFVNSGIQRRVREIKKFPGAADVALVRFSPAVKSVKPVKLLETALSHNYGKFKAVVLGLGAVHRDRLVQARNSKSIKHIRNSNGSRPGSAGFSGGGFVIVTKTLGPVQVGINHGKGVGVQPAYVSKWLRKTVPSAKWVKRALLLDVIQCEKKSKNCDYLLNNGNNGNIEVGIVFPQGHLCEGLTNQKECDAVMLNQCDINGNDLIDASERDCTYNLEVTTPPCTDVTCLELQFCDENKNGVIDAAEQACVVENECSIAYESGIVDCGWIPEPPLL